MDEILALQQELAEAQKGSSAQKLSDRNCVELVMKLQSLKLIDLIFTRSGKEYLTHKQLTIEIEDEILARGGRVNIIDLPDALNVDLVHIQSKLPQIISDSDGSTRLVRGEILTDYYLSTVAEEINDALTSSEQGTDNIGAIASRYALPVDIIRETVAKHQQYIINASLDVQNPDVLRSAASIERNRAAARGLLRAITTPTALSDVAKLRALPLALVATLVEEMLEEGSLCGSRVGRGARALFVPSVFAKAAKEAAVSVYTANGFITLDRLSKMYIQDIDAFVAERLGDAVVLGECVVGPTLLDTLATSTEEAVQGDGWIDVEVALPPDFPQGDVGAVLSGVLGTLDGAKGEKDAGDGNGSVKSSRSKRKNKGESKAGGKDDVANSSLVYGSRFIVSPQFVRALNESLCVDAVQKAEERARVMTEKMAMVVTQTGADQTEEKQETAPTDGGKKGKGKGRRRAGGKDKSGKQSAANGSSNSAGHEDEFPISKPSVEEAIEIILADEAWCAAIETDYLGSSTAGDEMLYSIVEEAYGNDGLSTLYQTKAEEAVVNLMRERALAKKNAEKALLAGLEDAELYNKAAGSLLEEELVQLSRSWVLATLCVNTLCRIVDAVAQSTGIVDGNVSKAHEQDTRKEKLEIIRGVVGKLAPTLETKLRLFINVVSDKKDEGTVEDFLTLYDDNATLFDLPERRPLDKKSEKLGFANARAQLMIALEQEGASELDYLNAAATLVHAKSCGGSIVAIPSEDVVKFCTAIEDKARPAELGEALGELRQALSEESAEEAMGEGFAEKLGVLRELIG